MLFPHHKGSKSFRTCKLFRKKNDVFLKIFLGLSTGVNVMGIPYSTIGQGVSKYVFDMKLYRWTIFRYMQSKTCSVRNTFSDTYLCFSNKFSTSYTLSQSNVCRGSFKLHNALVTNYCAMFDRSLSNKVCIISNNCSCSSLVVSFISFFFDTQIYK